MKKKINSRKKFMTLCGQMTKKLDDMAVLFDRTADDLERDPTLRKELRLFFAYEIDKTTEAAISLRRKIEGLKGLKL